MIKRWCDDRKCGGVDTQVELVLKAKFTQRFQKNRGDENLDFKFEIKRWNFKYFCEKRNWRLQLLLEKSSSRRSPCCRSDKQSEILFSGKLKFNKKFIAIVKSKIELMAFSRVWWFIRFIAVDLIHSTKANIIRRLNKHEKITSRDENFSLVSVWLSLKEYFQKYHSDDCNLAHGDSLELLKTHPTM